ncbi:MAG: hypothetical protein U0931_06490 [Vulcanimicrobiota bacterium]
MLLTRSHWRRFWPHMIGVFLPALLMIAVTLKQQPLVEPAPVYRSRARLLISPSSRGSYWEYNPLTDPRTIHELLQDQDLLAQAVNRSGLPLTWVDLRSALQVNTSGQMQRRVDLIELSVVGPEPEQLGCLNANLVACLGERMRDLAVREQDKTIATLRGEVRRARTQLEESFQRLRRCPTGLGEPEMVRLNQLRQSSEQLEKDLREVEMSGGGEPRNTCLEQEFERQRLELAALRNVYRDAAAPVLAQASRLRRLEAMVRKEHAESQRRRDRIKQARANRLRQRLKQVGREISMAQSREPGLKAVLQRASLERELNMWQANLEGLQAQLMQARFLREQNAARLNIVVVEKPQRGVAVQLPSSRKMALELCSRRLPPSLFVGLVLVLAFHTLRNQFKIEQRIVDSLDLPVLGRIPVLPRELSREWERIEQRRTQVAGGG